ncbi:FimB/Mfa2 family fimbrial subunit [Sphingobacterium thalpophilum]|uniref:FimB/Mfa2 family fimbrial subunit n=1 Tax=Sphingobacterium thalpophilum TaxID=259 RepID=A0ABV4H881_9SPHI
MKNITMKLGFASFLSLALLIASCSKDNSQPIVEAGTTVRLNIGQSYVKADPAKVGATGRKYVAKAQTVEIPFDNQYTLVATLTEENAASASGLRAANRAATVSSANEQVTLKEGTTYYVAIFDAAGVYKETKSFTQGNGAQDFAIEKGKYTFVIYASGTNKALPRIEAGATLSAVNFTGLTADQDFMLDQVEYEVKEGQNVLNADLAHLFTQVSLKFDASAIGVVGSIAGASIEPSNAAVDVALSDGALSFKGDVNPVTFRLKNTSGSIINSDSTFITTSATSNGIVRLKGVSIGGSAAKDVNKGGWNLKPGVKYILEFTLKAPLGGLNVGGHIWAPGNLVYSNGKYSFAQPNQLATLWYYNWLTPVGVGSAPSYEQMPTYSVDRDPCKMVDPAWRTPSKSDFEALFAEKGAATDWQYNYNGAEGVFYGSTDLPAMAANPGAYLFFPGMKGGTSFYWSSQADIGNSNESNAFSVKFGGYNKPNGFGNDNKTNGYQIRCVRN